MILLNKESKKCGGKGVSFSIYRKAIYKLRDERIGKTWSTYLPSGIYHTITQSDQSLTKVNHGMTGAEWLTMVLDNKIVHRPELNIRP